MRNISDAALSRFAHWMRRFARVGVRAFLLVSLIGVLGAGSVFAQQSGSLLQQGTVIDEIVAVVDGNLILRSELQMMMAQVMRQQQFQNVNRNQLRRQVLERLIDQEVVLIHAQNDTTVTVSDERVDQALDQRIDQLAQQLGGENAIVEQFGKSIVQIRNDYRSQIRQQLLVQQMEQTKMQEIRITPSEVRSWFEQIPKDSLPRIPETVRVAHIVRYPEVEASAREDARARLEAIRDSIVNGGASFEAMARQHSEDPGSASRGGRFENFNINELVPEFGAKAAQLDTGEVSNVFETSYGFHIMRLNDKVGDIIDFNHILIRVDENQTDATAARRTLRMLRDSLQNTDVPFERLAKEFSEDPESKKRGGFVTDPQTGSRDLPVSQLSSSWQSTLDTMQVGEISAPAQVELQNGRTAWHIVWLQRRSPSHIANLQDDYERIQQLALQSKRQREIQQWYNRLREDVYVDIKLSDDQLSAR